MATPSIRFSDRQKSELVQRIITGGVSLQQACAQYGLTTDQVKQWVRLFRVSARRAIDHQLRNTLSRRGLELDDLSRAELSGNLVDIGVADLLQTIHMGRKDAHITITHAALRSEIWCRSGQVVDALSGSLSGEAAVYRIMALEQGRLVADFAPNERARRVELTTPLLLLKAASSKGLRARVMQRLGDPNQVFSVATELAARRAQELEPAELELLGLFDGRRGAEDVIFASGLSDPRALSSIVRFREEGLLLPVAVAHAGSVEDSPSPSSGLTMSYRPFATARAPQPVRLPFWLLGAGAALCSSLGAVTAVAYANAFWSAEPPAASAQPASHALEAAPAPAPGAAPPALGEPALAAPLAPKPLACPADMVLIGSGEFMMGSDSTLPALDLAAPAHPVRMDSFCLGIHEVTVSEYGACDEAGDCPAAHRSAHFAAEASEETVTDATVTAQGSLCNAGRPGRELHPINCVSHEQAASYCEAQGGRLPTEAEWEFAARGSESRPFPWGNATPTHAHINACGAECVRWHAGERTEPPGLMYGDDDGYAGTAPVGSFPMGSTLDGVEDLIGNVFEWTAGGLYRYERAPDRNPRGPSSTDSFVIRGGNFNSALREFADPALRFAMHRDSYSHGVGFRCAADPR